MYLYTIQIVLVEVLNILKAHLIASIQFKVTANTKVYILTQLVNI